MLAARPMPRTSRGKLTQPPLISDSLEEVAMFRTQPASSLVVIALGAGILVRGDEPAATQGAVTPLMTQPLAGIEGKEVWVSNSESSPQSQSHTIL